MKARFTEAAKSELQDARVFYGARNPRARAEFNAEIRRAVALLQQRPLAGKRIGRRARELVLAGRFPYSLIYHVDDGAVVIGGVAHHRREPDYWHDRYGPDL